ncbi:MAG: hypothetical protein QOF81_946, partial [Acidimicrobiaceae bacterium]|nr:hypothetical protein [Acidimicrobiaceae bacterium]
PPMAKVAETLAAWATPRAEPHPRQETEVSDVANEIADVLAGDLRRADRERTLEAEADAVVDKFADHIQTFLNQLHTAGLTTSGLTAAHEGASGALQGFADGIQGGAQKWLGVRSRWSETPGETPLLSFRSGAAAAVGIDHTVVLATVHSVHGAGGQEVLWEGSSGVILLGSSELDREIEGLAAGFLTAVPVVLQRFLRLIRGDSPPS